MSRRRRGRVAALLAAMLGLAGCAAQPGPVSSSDSLPEGAPLVAFYGDSYTLGTGASDPALRWSTIICRDRGWAEFNPSVNGLGFVNNRSADRDLPGAIIERRPDLVIVTMGLNDNFSYAGRAADIRAQIRTDLERLSTGLPDARIVVVEPFWYTDERPPSVEVIIDWVRDEADRIHADFIPGASRWIEGHPEWMAPDRLHPNDDGYAEMARRMDEELTRIGL